MTLITVAGEAQAKVSQKNNKPFVRVPIVYNGQRVWATKWGTLPGGFDPGTEWDAQVDVEERDGNTFYTIRSLAYPSQQLPGMGSQTSPEAPGRANGATANQDSRREDIARSVALKAAVDAMSCLQLDSIDGVIGTADAFLAWLLDEDQGEGGEEVPF